MEALKQQVAQLIEQEPTLLPAAIAERLEVSEFEAVAALPEEMIALAPGEQAQSVLGKPGRFWPSDNHCSFVRFYL